jgi:hypothetical protein
LSHAKAKGLDITDRGVQEALFSMSVQHGGAKKIVNSIGNVSNDPNEQVKALYAARTNYVSNLTSLPNATKSSVLNRYQREQNDSLALAGIKDTKESTNELASLGLLTKEALSQKVLPKVDDRPSLDNRVIERQQQVAGIRKLSLKSDLKDKLGFAAEKSNLYWESTSGGQKFGGPRTGSHRHNIDIPGTPGASDGKLYELDANGKRRYLSIYNKDDLPKINKFVENFTAVTPGSGVGANYMGVGAERGQLLHMGGPNKPGGPAANYKGQSHVGEGFQRGLDRFGKPETQAEFEAYIKARDNPDKKPSDRVIETVPELSKETIPLKDRGFAAMSMAARNQTIALKNDAETTAAPAAIPVPTQTIDLAAKPAATPVEQAKPDTRQADAQMLEANNVEPVLPPPATEKVPEPVADHTKTAQSSTPKPVNDAPGNATQGGAYGGGTRHNPETRAATPGSGGRGSAGRCYL